jgi:hypothetical protein
VRVSPENASLDRSARRSRSAVVYADDAGNPVTDCPDPQAPKGTRLPLTAKYKGNVTARYAFDFQGWDSYFQAAGFFDGRRTSDLRLVEREIMGDIRATAPSISQPA